MFLFALRILVSDRGKLLLALVGVVFSLVLVNVQGGLFLGLVRKASLLVDQCEADIWIGRRGVENVDLSYEIPETLLARIRGLSEIQKASPYIVGYSWMSLPNEEFEGVWVVGFDPSSMLGAPRSFSDGGLGEFARPNSISVDELDEWRLGRVQTGDVVELVGRRARVVAKTKGLLGFMFTPYVFTSIDTAREYAKVPPGRCSFFLVKVVPGTNLQVLCGKLRRLLPELDVYTRDQFSWESRSYWVSRTGIGLSFGAATILGLLVGLVIVAQSLYALALDHLDDYATLKAIGAEDRHIYQVLGVQGATLACCGMIIGVAFSYVIQHFFSTPLAPIEIPIWLTLSTVALVAFICLVASILPFRRIRNVDPIVVLQG